jgi:mRNA-degrading endonuclease RelE of RelBE toxin-antitoxin system
VGKDVVWSPEARAQLRAINQATAIRILHTLDQYLNTGEGDIKRLHGIEPPEFRLRVGDYRVRFHHHEGTIRVSAVKHRREAYR